MHAVVVGAGIGGLTAAIGLARGGHYVTVVERDDTPMPPDVEGAFAWQRRGAPQVRHTHGFPALLRVTLRDRFPDVLDALRAAGVGEVSILPDSVTPDMANYERDAEDLQVLSARRTTLEWVLRRCALAEPGVAFVTGETVDALLVPPPKARFELRGVLFESGPCVEADVVVAATGRRDALPTWLADCDITISEEEHPTGTIYLSRFYRAGDDAPMGYRGGRRAGIGFVLAGADNRTYSATLAIPADDAELRAHLLDPDRFEASLALFKEMAPVVARQGSPITDVQTMGGLVNRRRSFTDNAGAPLAPGLFAIGDAHTCTNPVYGRGSSLATLQAVLLCDALAAHPDDLVAAGRAYEAASEARVRPWYEMSLMTDKPEAADFTGFDLQSMRRAAASTDPEIATVMTKMMSLLITPQEAFADPGLVARLEAAAAPKERVPDPNYRPLTRDDILSVRG